MTSNAAEGTPPTDLFYPWLETDGLTMTIDFMFGKEAFLVKRLAAFLSKDNVKALLIDPAVNNARAIHVYQKVGFKIVDKFVRASGYFAGVEHYLMKIKFQL